MTPDEIIEQLGGRTEVARVTNRPSNTVVYWQRRGHIPLAYWPLLVEHASTLPDCKVTFETLAKQRSGAAA